MLLFLHPTIEALSDDDLEIYNESIGNLLDSHRYQRHLFLPTRTFAQRLSRFNSLSVMQRKTAAAIVQKHNDFSPIRQGLACAFGVCAGAISGLPPGNSNEKWLPIEIFRDENVLRGTRLVVENSANDAKILQMLIFIKMDAEGIGRSFWNIESRHGAGSQMSYVLREVFREGGPMVGLADSDRKWPWSRAGDTARFALVEWKKLTQGSEEVYRRLHILSVHEIENLIPIDFIQELLLRSKDPGIRSLSALASQIKSIFANWPNLDAWEQDAYFCFDLKNGINLTNARCPQKWNAFLEEYKRRIPTGVIPGISTRLAEIIHREWEHQFGGSRNEHRRIWSYVQAGPIGRIVDDLTNCLFAIGIRNPMRIL